MTYSIKGATGAVVIDQPAGPVGSTPGPESTGPLDRLADRLERWLEARATPTAEEAQPSRPAAVGVAPGAPLAPAEAQQLARGIERLAQHDPDGLQQFFGRHPVLATHHGARFAGAGHGEPPPRSPASRGLGIPLAEGWA